jgi:ketosteroid isomerase-like protein
MSERARIEALLRGIYAQRSAGNMDGIMASFGPDPSFRLAGDEILGVLTTEVKGRDALRQMMQQLVDAWDWTAFEVDSILVDGSRVVVHSKGTMRFVPTGQKFVTETLDLLTLADDKIVDFLQFCDTHMAAKAMGLAA